MTVRLKKRVSTRRPVGPARCKSKRSQGQDGSGSHNDNGTSEAMATKKKTSRKTSEVIEEPVVLKVMRTTKKKFADQAAEELATIRQEGTEPKDADDDDDTEIDEEYIEVRRFMTEPARVNYHYTLGRNTHYQSVSIGVSVTLPCYKEEVEGALVEAKQIVADRLKIENRKTGAVLDHLVKQRIEKDQELANQGIR